jgi:hypothetical protein
VTRSTTASSSGVTTSPTTRNDHRIIRPSMTVLAVDTNFGWFATLFARWVAPRGFVHAFEPVPFIHDLATELSGQQLHFASEIESGRSRSRARLDDDSYIRGSPRGHSTVAPLGREDVVAANGCEVPTLDDYCEENRVPRRRFHESRRRGSLAAPRQCWPHRLRPARSIEPEHIFNELRSAGYAHFFRFSIRAGVRPVQAKL